MLMKTLNQKTFLQLFEVLKENITDVLLHFHPDSIKIRAADHGRTHITYVNILGKELEHYTCERYQPVGINVAKLWTVLKIANADDILQMEHDSNAGQELNISVIDAKTNAVKFKTGYITYDTTEEALQIPETISFDSCITMKSHNFYTNLKYLESLEAEFVKLKQGRGPNGKNRLQLIGIGSLSHKSPCIDIDELDNDKNVENHHLGSVAPSAAAAAPLPSGVKKVKVAAPVASSAATVTKQQPPTSARELKEIELVFPLKKLVQFAKAHCLDTSVGIHLDEKGFLILQYKIKILGTIKFVVMATRTDSDEEEDDDDEDSAADDDAKDNAMEEDQVNEKKRSREEEEEDGEKDTEKPTVTAQKRPKQGGGEQRATERKRQQVNDDDEEQKPAAQRAPPKKKRVLVAAATASNNDSDE